MHSVIIVIKLPIDSFVLTFLHYNNEVIWTYTLFWVAFRQFLLFVGIKRGAGGFPGPILKYN